MTTIILPPDLEARLAAEARKQGTTPELLALDALRQRFVPTTPAQPPEGEYKSLADFLAGYIGVIGSSEHVPGGARMSEDCGKKFADGMEEKRKQGRL